MSAYLKFDQFIEDVMKGVHGNLDAANIKIMLSNVAPVPGTAKVKADITEIAAGNGYIAGGTTAAFVSGAQTGGVFKYVLGQVTFTAAGGSIGPFRYVVVYNSSVAGGPLIVYYDYGVSLTITDGNNFLTALDQTNGLFQAS